MAETAPTEGTEVSSECPLLHQPRHTDSHVEICDINVSWELPHVFIWELQFSPQNPPTPALNLGVPKGSDVPFLSLPQPLT